jgi:YjjG family noncanonical pyrimidine nucleotidase
MGVPHGDELYRTYRAHGADLWGQLERGLVTKDFLKVERFQRTFLHHGIEFDPARASHEYLEILSETVVMIEEAAEVCEFLAARGEVGIITNGIDSVQRRRLKNSPLFAHISFMAVSEECGFAKPDGRFFEYTSRLAKTFSKPHTLVIGDRLEADIDGAHAFGLDACWFNPRQLAAPAKAPKYTIRRLSELKQIVG